MTESQTHNPGLLLRQAPALTELQQGKQVRAKGRVSRAISKQHGKVRVTDGGSAPLLHGHPQSQCEGSDTPGRKGDLCLHCPCFCFVVVLFPTKVKIK